MDARSHATNDQTVGFGRAALLTRGRWSLAVAGILYFCFGLAYQVLVDHPYDPAWQRAVVSALCFAYVGFTFSKRATEVLQSVLLVTLTLAISAHTIYLVAMNDLSMTYVLGAYCAMFATGVVLLEPRKLAIYYGAVATFTFQLWWARGDLNSFFLFLGSVCAMAISFVSSATVLSLFASLDRSRRSLAAASAELTRVNKNLGNITDSLGQGLFTFGASGVCGQTYSKACLLLLGEAPAGRGVHDVLARAYTSREDFQAWVDLAFTCDAEVRPAVLSLGPKRLDQPDGRVVTFEYYPVTSAEGRLSEVVVVATDRTLEFRSIDAAATEAARLKMIATIVEQRALFMPFLRDLIAKLNDYARAESSPVLTQDFRRFLHTMKGGFGTFAIENMARVVHGLEDEWAARTTEDDVELVRDQSRRLGEGVRDLERELTSILGHTIVDEQRTLDIPLDQVLALITRASRRENLVDDLVRLTLQPVGAHFRPYETLVRRLAIEKQKNFGTFTMVGAELMIFPEPYHDVFAAFVHVFRNAMDHGFESAGDRAAAGKPAAARIAVQFETLPEDSLRITVTDDGRGIDAEILREKLTARGVAANYPTPATLLNAIFEMDVSTRAEVSELSGRGVGLNALKVAVEARGGSVGVRSELGRGTEIWVELPLVRPALRRAA